MNKFAAFAIGAAPFVAVGGGIVMSRLMPPHAVEAGFLAGQTTSSCVEINRHTFPDLPTYSAGDGDAWGLSVYADAHPPSCRRTSFLGIGGDIECSLTAPALVSYSSTHSGIHLYTVETIGEHRVRANQHGLSCRQMS